MEGNDHDNRPGSDRQYREGLMTGLLIALANQVCVLASWRTLCERCFSAV